MNSNEFAFLVSAYKPSELEIFSANRNFFDQIVDRADIKIAVNPGILKKAHTYEFGKIAVEIIPGIPDFFTPFDEGSYRHAGNLNLLIEKFGSNYDKLVLCDPDIIFTNPKALKILVETHGSGSAIIGSEWDKTIPSKWRDFPAPHLISIDMSKINFDVVDMRPALEKSFKKRNAAKKLKGFITDNKLFLLRKLNGFLTFILVAMKRNLSSDTGYHFREYTKFHSIPVSLIVNEVNYYNLLDLTRIRRSINRFIRNWAPDLIGIIPRVNVYRSALIEKHFHIYKYLRPEELSIGGSLIAFHFRSVKTFHRGSDKLLSMNMKNLNEIVTHASSASMLDYEHKKNFQLKK